MTDSFDKKKLNELPSAVPIIARSDNQKFDLDEKKLEELLLQEDVKDRFVVVVSVAGAFRKGKSFLLDFFLRYVKAIYSSSSTEGVNWIGLEDEPLIGFPWRGGCERDTAGILLWSEIFLTTLENNEKVAILFLDTQGTFDSESTMKECATIFALSTMISSVQIFNLSQNIQEDDLQHLQLFTEYGRLALADSGEKPFQKLQFLIRDWSYPYEAEFGENGGRIILDRRLKVSEKQHSELQSIRNHIRSCFEEINCFLLPHPGLKVATNQNFDGRLSDIEPEFIKYTKQFIISLMTKENLTLKVINGQKVKAKELLQYFRSYINIYKSNELPEPKSLLMATAEANNLSAVASSKEFYDEKMENICGGNKPYIKSNILQENHLKFKAEAIAEFVKKKKMGGEEFSDKYKIKLESDIDNLYIQYQSQNTQKNVFKTAKTPSIFFCLIIIFYIISSIFHMIGISLITCICNMILWISIITIFTWAYCQYCGDMSEIGQKIDGIANGIWEEIMKPFFQTISGKVMESVLNNVMVDQPPNKCTI